MLCACVLTDGPKWDKHLHFDFNFSSELDNFASAFFFFGNSLKVLDMSVILFLIRGGP
jgi:hypothetical protein